MVAGQLGANPRPASSSPAVPLLEPAATVAGPGAASSCLVGEILPWQQGASLPLPSDSPAIPPAGPAVTDLGAANSCLTSEVTLRTAIACAVHASSRLNIQVAVITVAISTKGPAAMWAATW
mmetsp:Transcript_20381/g.47688  ORF Transcript_20381/g.47688 Transcript_20381/m.47688 type:complete len:122 (+) Transcript_20381:371-736(+)